MNAKKILSLLLAGVMTVSMLAGCGSNPAATAQTEAKPAAQTEAKAAAPAPAAATEKAEETNNYSDTITLVWYPNESADDFGASRDEVARLVEQATGKKVEQKLTTDYAIAIEAIASGAAQIGCVFGAEGYIQAEKSNAAVKPLFVHSGSSGTLSDAVYYAFFGVKEENAANYADGDGYAIDNVAGQKMSFVSNSSTSGFKVPTNDIITHFADQNLTVDDLMEGGSKAFFSEVLFGGSHQGSLYNLLTGKCDVAAFCDKEVVSYVELVSGEDKTEGAVYAVKEGADAPFDTLAGTTYTVINSTPVMNGPFVYNSETLSPEDAAAIQELFTSEEVKNNPIMFYDADAQVKGLFKKSGDIQFLTVDASWYDPIREMGK